MATYYDAVFFLASASGTGDFGVASAIQGYRTPGAASVPNAAVGGYRAESSDLTQWEVGVFTYSTTGPTVVRTTVLSNSLGTTAKINFTAAPNVGFVELSKDLVDASNLTAGTLPDNRLSNTITAGSVGSSSAIPVLTYDAHGRLTAVTTAAPTSTGRYLGTTTHFSTNSSITPPAGATAFKFRMQAAGGGSSGKPAANCCGINPNKPGGAGAYLEGYVALIVGAINFTLGAAGAAGASGSNNGGNASNSTLVHNGNTWTAPGGVGGTTTAVGTQSSAPTVVNAGTDWGIRGGPAVMVNLASQGTTDIAGTAYRGIGVFRGAAAALLYGSGGPGVISTPASAGIAGAVGFMEIDWYS